MFLLILLRFVSFLQKSNADVRRCAKWRCADRLCECAYRGRLARRLCAHQYRFHSFIFRFVLFCFYLKKIVCFQLIRWCRHRQRLRLVSFCLFVLFWFDFVFFSDCCEHVRNTSRCISISEIYNFCRTMSSKSTTTLIANTYVVRAAVRIFFSMYFGVLNSTIQLK